MSKKNLEDIIFRAADSLFQASGKSPTNAEVRAKVGGGSLADISPIMKRWRDRKDKEAAEAMRAPEEVENIARDLAMNIWREAKDTAALEYRSQREKFEHDLKVLGEDLQQSYSETERLEKALAENEKSLSDQNKEVGALQHKRDQDALVISELKQENARLQAKEEMLLKQLEDLKAQLSGAHAATKNLQDQLVAIADSHSRPD